jgi:hypothetical protein
MVALFAADVILESSFLGKLLTLGFMLADTFFVLYY